LVEGEFSRQLVLPGVDLTVVLLLGLDRCQVVDRGVEAVLVEPVDPGQGRELELVNGLERVDDLDALVPVEPDDLHHPRRVSALTPVL
jgi:hypothetical protein